MDTAPKYQWTEAERAGRQLNAAMNEKLLRSDRFDPMGRGVTLADRVHVWYLAPITEGLLLRSAEIRDAMLRNLAIVRHRESMTQAAFRELSFTALDDLAVLLLSENYRLTSAEAKALLPPHAGQLRILRNATWTLVMRSVRRHGMGRRLNAETERMTVTPIPA